MRETIRQVQEERARLADERINEKKAATLLNNVLRLNEKLVAQLQAIGKSRRGPWMPNSGNPHDIDHQPPPLPSVSRPPRLITASSGKSLSRSVGTERSKSAPRRRSKEATSKDFGNIPSRLHHTTNAHEQRMRAQLPRSEAQLKSVEQREVAHFDREVDRLESDFIRMKKDFHRMIDQKESMAREEGEKVMRSLSPEQVRFEPVRESTLEGLRSNSPGRHARRSHEESKETLESLGLAEGFQHVLDSMDAAEGELAASEAMYA